MFYPPNTIDAELNRLFAEIHSKNMLIETDKEKQLQNLYYVMSELNIIHPFREGNGRAIRELIRCFALRYDIELNWGNTDKDNLLNASINSVDNNMAFCEVIKSCINN